MHFDTVEILTKRCSFQQRYLALLYRDYAPKSIEMEVVSSLQRSQLIDHTIFFTSEKRRIDALIGCTLIFTSEQNRVARSSLLLTDKQYISKSLGAFFFTNMALNQTNRLQCLDSPVEEFIDGQENENTKKKTKHDVALFHEFLVVKGETRRMNKLTPQQLYKFLSARSSFLRFAKKKTKRNTRGIEWSLRAVRLFLRARAVINFLMRAASTFEITNSEH